MVGRRLPSRSLCRAAAGDILNLRSHHSCGRWDKLITNSLPGQKGSTHGKAYIPCKETGSKGQSLPRGQYVMFAQVGERARDYFLFHNTVSATLGTLPCSLNKTPCKACPFSLGFYLMRAELVWTAVLPLQEKHVITVPPGHRAWLPCGLSTSQPDQSPTQGSQAMEPGLDTFRTTK